MSGASGRASGRANGPILYASISQSFKSLCDPASKRAKLSRELECRKLSGVRERLGGVGKKACKQTCEREQAVILNLDSGDDE